MLQSKVFTKTLREAPKDEQSKNAQFLIRAGYIDKLMAGVYSFLPLGLRVINNIANIIREEMNAIGGQEILMPALHPLENYQTTKRDGIDILFHTEVVSGQKIVLGQSHEEIVVPLMQKYIESYRDLPLAVYQIQTKFRNELRPKSGIFRGREFIMKDLYSFHADEKDFQTYYERVIDAYFTIFERVGIKPFTHLTYASGGTFSQYSHEFQVRTAAGEDAMYLCAGCLRAVNSEIAPNMKGHCPNCNGALANSPEKAIEIGNIFPLGTRFSDAFGLTHRDTKGNNRPVVMGCYGIGVSRLMGTIAELFADQDGLVWPEAVTPYKVHLLSLTSSSRNFANTVYTALEDQHIATLFDDREGKMPGERFGDADLMGIPWRVVVSDKTVAENKIEIKKRGTSETSLVDLESFIHMIS